MRGFQNLSFFYEYKRYNNHTVVVNKQDEYYFKIV